MRDEEHVDIREEVHIHLHIAGPITVNMNGPPVTSPPGVAERMAAELVKDNKQMRQSLLMAQAAVVALVHSQTDLTTAYAAYVADEPKRQAAAVADALAADGADEDTIAQAIQDTTATAAANVSAALDAIHANTSNPSPPDVSTLPVTTPATGDESGAASTQGGGGASDSLGGGAGGDSVDTAGGGQAADTILGGQGDDSLNGGNGSDAVVAAPILATPVVADDSTPTAADLAANDPASVITADGAVVAVVSTDPTLTAQVGSPASVIVTDHPTDGTTLLTPVLSPDTPAAGSVTVDETTGAPTAVAS